MNNTSKTLLQVFIFGGIMLFGITVYVDYFVMRGQIKGIEKKAKKADTEIADLKTELQELKDLESQRDRIMALKAQVEEKAKRLPQEAEIPELINILRRMLKMTNVRIEAASQQKPLPRRAYYEIPYNLKCHSGYHNFGQFLNLVEVNPDRLLRVKEFEIEIDEENPQVHDVDVTVAAYVTRKR